MAQSKIRSYRDLVTWQRAMQLAEASYRIASSLPTEDRFGLAQQIRRAAVSIPSNIAEGHNGRTRQVFLNHLAIALGSQAELETELELALRLGNADVTQAQALAAEVGKLLHGLIATIEQAVHLQTASRSLPPSQRTQ
jgi:four helix bundle protein